MCMAMLCMWVGGRRVCMTCMRVRLGAPAEQVDASEQARTEELLPVECGVRDGLSGSEVLRSGPGHHQDSERCLHGRLGIAPFHLAINRKEIHVCGPRAWYDPGTLLFSYSFYSARAVDLVPVGPFRRLPPAPAIIHGAEVV